MDSCRKRPENLQTALFSATMPNEIRRVADRYLENPATVEGEHKTVTVPTIHQRYLQVAEPQKLDALAQLLETESVAGRRHADLCAHQIARRRSGRTP